jgi:hypothetical protein
MGRRKIKSARPCGILKELRSGRSGDYWGGFVAKHKINDLV